jgi:Zn-finger nucleic acid-binding protein
LTSLNAGRVTVDVCSGGCGGVWFDNFELRKVTNPDEIDSDALLHVAFNPALEVDYERRRRCPRCPDIVMMRRFYSGRRQVVVEECPNCGGLWLDAGELQMIRHETQAEGQRQQAARGYVRGLFDQEFMKSRHQP